MTQQFCPRLSEAIGSKFYLQTSYFVPLEILNFRILQLEHFTHIYLIYEGKLQKNVVIPQKTGGFCT